MAYRTRGHLRWVSASGEAQRGGIASLSAVYLMAIREAVGGSLVQELRLRGGEGEAWGVLNRWLRRKWAKARFASSLLRIDRDGTVVFDHVGLAVPFLARMRPPRHAILVHGLELNRVRVSRSLRLALARADVVVANSFATAETVRRLVPATSSVARVVYPCLDPGLRKVWENAEDREGEDSIDLGEGPVAAIVGRMDSSQPGKGHDSLIRIWPRVMEGFPEAKLVIVGTGDDQSRLKRLVASSVEGHVFFMGGVDAVKLGRVYRAADVLAMPSRQDGFGIVFVEAMWHGTPCIGSTCGGVAEVVEHNRTGLTVDPYDEEDLYRAISRLFEDDTLKERLGAEARRRAQGAWSYGRFREDVRSLVQDLGY